MSNLIQIQDCKGIDCAIKRAQTFLYNELITRVGSINWNCFPRIYKTKILDSQNKLQFIPEFLNGKKEYTADTFFSDKVDLTSFFLVAETRDVLDYQESKVNVSIVFSGYPSRFYTTPTKADEHLLVDVQDICQQLGGNWNLTKIATSVDEVYREFYKKELEFSDMSEKHLLRLDFILRYQNC